MPHVLPYFIAADEETKSVVVAIRGGLAGPLGKATALCVQCGLLTYAAHQGLGAAFS